MPKLSIRLPDLRRTLFRVLPTAILASIAWACAPKNPPITGPPTDAQLRGLPPEVQGDWLVTEPGKPRMTWTFKQSGLALTGTITVDPRDAASAAATPASIKGTLVGVGAGWQARLDQPVGYMTVDSLQFVFCPLAGGVGGCRTGKKKFFFPGVSPATTSPVATGSGSPAAVAPSPASASARATGSPSTPPAATTAASTAP